ncbi:MAG: response regulator [Planctomycetota bacterium]|nr:MAG: response regulator [Planctomycetota bacterium]
MTVAEEPREAALVVDDDPDVAGSLADLLALEGLLVDTAASCAEALDLAARRCPALALVDLRLGAAADGLELTARLKEAHPETVCVLVTAYGSLDSAVAALRGGADDYLRKPVRPEELRAVVRRALRMRRLAGEQRAALEELRRSEARYRRLFDEVPAAIVLGDLGPLFAALEAHGEEAFVREQASPACWVRIVDANQQALRLFGAESTAALAAFGFAGILGPEGAELLREVSRAFRSGASRVEREVRAHSLDGRSLVLDMRLHVTSGPGGAAPQAVACFVDLTRQRELDAQLRQAQKMEAVGRLAGGIAHDFNNLLTSILGYAELAQRSGSPEDFAGLRGVVRRCAELTSRLLAFSRRGDGPRRSADLQHALHDTEALLRRTLGEDVALSVESDPALGAVPLSETELQQVFLNLAVNARDAMPGGGRLSLRARKVHDPRAGPSVAIEVADTGHGMDEETAARVFEPFFTTKGPGQGTGLGLSTVFGIVGAAGGRIEVDSAPGQGTTVRIYLPPAEEAPESDLAERSVPSAPPAPAGASVLVVEDEVSVRQVLVRLLEDHGYRVRAVASAEDALRAWEEEGPFSLLLSDVVLPGQSGPALARSLRRRVPELRALFVSGYAPESTVSAAELAELNLIPKPFAREDLLCRVRAALDAPASSGSGSQRVKQAPPPGSSVSSTSPPWSCRARATMAKPSPTP